MAKKLIYLIQERPRKDTRCFNPWQPNEAFGDILDATNYMDIEAKANPDTQFKLTQLPFTPKE